MQNSACTLAASEVTGLIAELLASGKAVRVKVSGLSMGFFLRGGEFVILQKTSAADIRRGDLILFKNGGGQLVLHRVLSIVNAASGLIFHTKGDALILWDEPTPETSVLGKVLRVEKTWGRDHTLNLDLTGYYGRVLNWGLMYYGRLRISKPYQRVKSILRLWH